MQFPFRKRLITTERPRCAEEDIVDFARRRLGLDADKWQEAVLRSTGKRGILNCTRQWGKTTVSAAKAVHRVFTVPGSLVIVASPGLRQSGEWLLKAEELLGRLDIRKRGRRAQQDLTAAAERVEDCGTAGRGGEDTRVLGAFHAGDR